MPTKVARKRSRSWKRLRDASFKDSGMGQELSDSLAGRLDQPTPLFQPPPPRRADRGEAPINNAGHRFAFRSIVGNARPRPRGSRNGHIAEGLNDAIEI